MVLDTVSKPFSTFTQDIGHTDKTDHVSEIPQYNPGAGYRQLEFLLGRIKSLTQRGDFTTLPGDFTG